MTTTIDAITIPNTLPEDSALSYNFLRKEGIKLIQQMAGHTWTDHNTHDPGITILEQVCYAITDLAYRMDYDIKDLLGTDHTSSYKDLHSAASILMVHPVTILDLRKIVMDVKGVKNAWIEKVKHSREASETEDARIIPKGLYHVFIEKDTLFESTGTKILAEVKNRLQACRSVCEDFEQIKILNIQDIRLQGIIEITDTVDDVHQLIANMLYRVSEYFSPRLSFYNISQLLAEGKRIDEIFDGPLLDHGFIKNEELLKHRRKKEIQASDIIREIMDESGVLAIDQFTIATGLGTIKSWVLALDPSKTPVLNIDKTLEDLSFTAKGLKINIDVNIIKNIYDQKRAEGLPKILPSKERDVTTRETVDRNIEKYYSIQNEFPVNYGIGTAGLPDSASETRKVQAKQLTSYLVFFEQLLANYFSQAANFKKLMSFDDQEICTYFNQSLLDTIPGIEEVLQSKESYEEYLKETIDAETNVTRKNKFLNHLLARFGEKFTGYAMLLQDISKDKQVLGKKLIKDKATFLKEYPELSSGRANAFNYTKVYWQNDNISGLEKRIARKLGIEEYTRRNLGDGETEGFHMVEHILLRPREQYPYPFSTSYIPQEITGFEAVEGKEHTRCFSKDHNLKIGEHIQIVENDQYTETYTIVAVEKDHFDIDTPFQESQTSGLWQRIPDIRYFIRSSTIQNFAAGSPDHTFCRIGTHDLQVGDTIEVTATQQYDGVHEITAITEEGFEIPVPFTDKETSGRWIRSAGTHDPYSLQVTFMLPNWIERYQNIEFKKFVEYTIQEETPAHIRVYLKWLNKKEMQGFDKAFHRFLEKINK
ncbi:hypothetical protein [Aquimarina algicola]|uniref:Uncharacterized protein n=1 Tax=Aquimarina algicola TaxID=2589995 RepID=A0A504JKI2_9FLAO|nr:hypothetical protein [Aquimarina algicola]TPN86990.1 hypothetical protein FHK87_05205 [Aquimarina algicola]